jgi:CRISPR/Cas system-associated exonuclease Cas4 (RecB family)
VEDGKMTILDYKTGKPHKKYEVQLQNYALTLSNMGYDVERKILVYIDTQISVNFVL